MHVLCKCCVHVHVLAPHAPVPRTLQESSLVMTNLPMPGEAQLAVVNGQVARQDVPSKVHQ